MSDDFTTQIARVKADEDAGLVAAREQAVALFARLSEDTLVECARRRAFLMSERFAATLQWPVATPVAAAEDAPAAGVSTATVPSLGPSEPHVAPADREKTGTSPGGGRSVRDIVLDVLGSVDHPVTNDLLAKAVMAEGWTRNGSDKMRRRLVKEGIVRESGRKRAFLYELVHPGRSGDARGT